MLNPCDLMKYFFHSICGAMSRADIISVSVELIPFVFCFLLLLFHPCQDTLLILYILDSWGVLHTMHLPTILYVQ